MKKIISLILVAAMLALALVSCAPKEEALDAKYLEFINEYKKANTGANGKLTVSLSPDFSPMEFVDLSKKGQDQYVGFDVILAYYIAKEFNMTLEIKPMDFNACQAAVQTATVDLSISGYSVTPERKENYLLSDYYYAGDNETEQIIVTTSANAGKFTKAEDFAGKKVGAQNASLQYNLCKEQLPETCEIKEFISIDLGIESLVSGKIDAMAVAKGNGDAIMVNNKNVAESGFYFEVSEEAENNVILINKNDNALLEKVNAALAKAYAAGLYGQWYSACEILTGIKDASEVSYDENGNPITEAPGTEATPAN